MKLIGFLFGAGFGFMLGWAGLTDYDVIRSMLLFRELDLYFMMGAAMATAAIGVRLLRRLGARSLLGAPVAWSLTKPSSSHVYGSILFGIGWGIAGTCPGPIAAQLGRGQLSALFTTAGVLAGVALFGYAKRRKDHKADAPLATATAGAAPGL
jgi:uncharacterized membrane protein YedE/YeeE